MPAALHSLPLYTCAMDKSSNLIWIDLEMTGLDTMTDTIIEIATVVTDKYLNELAEGPVIAIGQPKARMDGMDEWNTRQHGDTGLTARVLDSDITLQDAEVQTLGFLAAFAPRLPDHRQSAIACGGYRLR